MKTCSKCKVRKPRSEFYPNRTQSDGLAYYCKECARKEQSSIYAKDPEKYRRKALEYRAKHGPVHNKRRRENRRQIYITESARKYNTTEDRIRRLLEIRRCEICDREIAFSDSNVHHRPNIDHDHKNNEIRGMLCGYCNNMIGRAGDSPELLIKAAQYLHARS